MKRLVLFICLIASKNNFSQILTKVDSISISGANIWGVVCERSGPGISVTTVSGQQIYLRKFSVNPSLVQQGTSTQITFTTDPQVTDHKSIFLNNHYYISYSSPGDDDLYIFKIDTNGNRIGSIITVTLNTTGQPTNDMILTTDGTDIYVMHFVPTGQHKVYKYDQNLTPQAGFPLITSASYPHNNIGSAKYLGSTFHLFTGNNFGFNARVINTQWTQNWLPSGPATQTLVTPGAGEGCWFSTGIDYDAVGQRWFLGFQHINSGQTINQEHVDIAVLDNSFNILERKHISAPAKFRPHFLYKGGYLYVTYDAAGSGVYLLKYLVAASSGINEYQKQKISVYPNPTTDIIHVDMDNIEIELTDILGRKIKESESSELEVAEIENGVYFLKVQQNKKLISTEKIVIQH